MPSVAERFAQVEDRIAEACRVAGRARSSVRLVAISKKQPDARLEAALALGHEDFGENYPQELDRKRRAHPGVRWHQVGHVQRNKAKLVADCELVHSLDSLKLARALDAGEGAPTRALIQVNQAAEGSKTGLTVDALTGFFENAASLSGLRIQGLMTIPPPGEGARYFDALRELRDAMRVRTGLPLEELSMGMSDDFEAAIRAGATLIRVGSALFGPRP